MGDLLFLIIAIIIGVLIFSPPKGKTEHQPGLFRSLVFWFFDQYAKITQKTCLEVEFKHPLVNLVKTVVIIFGIGLWVLGIVAMASFDISFFPWIWLWAILMPVLYIFQYAIWKHFYLRHLYKLSIGKAKRSIYCLTCLILLISTLLIYLLVHNSADSRINRFNAILAEARESEFVEKECIEGITLGMQYVEYNKHLEELEANGLIEKENGYILYTKYNTPEFYDSKLYIEEYYRGGRIYKMEIKTYSGNGLHGLELDLFSSGRMNGFKKIDIPETKFTSNAEFLHPDYFYSYCNSKNLYEYGDELFIKDNMLIIISRMYSRITFVNMRDMEKPR